MGSYNRHKFEANTYDQKVIAAVLEVITKEYEAPDCFGKWGDYDKWYGAGDMALGLSKKFPKVMFSLQRAGESGYGHWFYLAGECVNAAYVLPAWPSYNKFKLGAKTAAKLEAAAAKKQAEADKLRVAANKQLKIEQLERQLNVLKAG